MVKLRLFVFLCAFLVFHQLVACCSEQFAYWEEENGWREGGPVLLFCVPVFVWLTDTFLECYCSVASVGLRTAKSRLGNQTRNIEKRDENETRACVSWCFIIVFPSLPVTQLLKMVWRSGISLARTIGFLAICNSPRVSEAVYYMMQTILFCTCLLLHGYVIYKRRWRLFLLLFRYTTTELSHVYHDE